MRLLILSAFFLLSACAGKRERAPEPISVDDLTWIRQSAETPHRLQAVSAVSDHVVWLAGAQGTFARTIDGGAIWQVGQVSGAADLEFRDVHGKDASTAFLMSAGPGERSRIFRTTDAGTSWEEVYRNTEPGGFFDCMSFWDNERGIVFSDAPDSDFMLMVTSDGGDSWGRVNPDALDDAHESEGAFASSGTCLITGDAGRAWFGTGASSIDTRVYRTTDYGETWDAVVSPIPSTSGSSGIFTVAFHDNEHGLVLGGEFTRPDSTFGHTAATTDGGATWTMSGDTGLGGSVFGAAFIPGMPTPTVVAVAPTGSVISTDGGATWTRLNAENYWAVGASPEGGVWAVGPGGHIAKLQIPQAGSSG